ncbi:uncharacterized protein [Cherax quadricarinatus]|uniref:uncharacterized protein n=1 Tax=Cherax quadricarinatus TaxID=27406 RepID=UPI00387E832C
MAARFFLFFGFLMVMCQLMTAEGRVLKCQAPGRFPHPEDCGSYIDCIPVGSDGQLTANEGHCFGFPYSSADRRCVSHDQQPGCKTKKSRNSIPLPGLQFLCEKNKPVGCYHCKLAYKCIDGTPYVSLCQHTETCLEDEAFGGGACLPYGFPSVNDRCICTGTGLMSDSYNDTYYIYCDTSANPVTMEMFECPEGKTFTSSSNTCEGFARPPHHWETPETPLCDGPSTTRVNPNNCSFSYTCLPDNTTRSSYCGNRSYFNQDTGRCEDKCSFVTTVSSDAILCPERGNLNHPTDCTKYYVCLNKYEAPYALQSCPTGHFDFITQSCVSGPLPPECAVFTYSKCPGHDMLVC